jgi:hypothetical protein
VVINKKTREIICTDFSSGKKHDFKLFVESRIPFCKNQTILVDSGYTGIVKMYRNTNVQVLIPKKKTKKNPLTKEDKLNNINIAKQRIVVENVLGCLKRFRILGDKYRCRRKRFGLRFNLIAGIYNYELLKNSSKAKQKIVTENVPSHLRRLLVLEGKYGCGRKKLELRSNLVAYVYRLQIGIEKMGLFLRGAM